MKFDVHKMILLKHIVGRLESTKAHTAFVHEHLHKECSEVWGMVKREQ